MIGGARVWARFASAHISPGRSVALQSRNYLIAEGLRSLLFPLLLAAGSAAVVFLTFRRSSTEPPGGPLGEWESSFEAWRESDAGSAAILEFWAQRGTDPSLADMTIEDWLRHRFAQDALEKPPEREAKRAKEGGIRPFLAQVDVPFWTGAALAVGATVLVILSIRLNLKQAAEIVVLTIGTIAVVFLGLRRAVTRRSAATILFTAFALWSGAFEYLSTEGQRHPKLDLALVALKDEDETLAVGYFVARTDGDVYLAESVPRVEHGFRVRMFPKEHVVTFSFGPTRRIGHDDSRATLLKVFEPTR